MILISISDLFIVNKLLIGNTFSVKKRLYNRNVLKSCSNENRNQLNMFITDIEFLGKFSFVISIHTSKEPQ